MITAIKLLYYIECALLKIQKFFKKEYYLKLEEYYYDYERAEYMVVFRFRNRNAIVRESVTEIVKKNLINNLHPYDSYMIGSIKTMQDNKFILKNCFIERDFDDYSVIEPWVYWAGTDFTENKLIFKTKRSLSEIKVSIEWICKNFKFIRAVDPKNAFLIGSMVTNTYIQGYV